MHCGDWPAAVECDAGCEMERCQGTGKHDQQQQQQQQPQRTSHATRRFVNYLAVTKASVRVSPRDSKTEKNPSIGASSASVTR